MIKNTKSFFLWFSLCFISCQSNDNSSGQTTREKTDKELRDELKQKEIQSFADYLEVNCNCDQNKKPRTDLLGSTVIEGDISNNADIASFKDIVLEISFMSKTQTELAVRKYTVYELLNPKGTKPFKYKTIAPKETGQCSVRIIEATPVRD